MPKVVYSNWGLLHLIAALASLVLGTAVLVLSKGNKRHKQLGYSYVGSMTVMLATSFAIYRQFHSFGIFHVAALLSSITLCAGMVPVLRKKPTLSWQRLHYSFMYLSVLELYVALVAEVLVRRPGMGFWDVVSLSTATVLLPGTALFTRFYKRWQEPSYRPQPKLAPL
ncbi:hypothetical protein [Hymenobacter volaticus]|uniref:DUF2306 domain-containing protein n=1 Tax=Hymenobacter volaticus TaxID=2932254 RepID=A0ABY4G9G3_9BACT|nr:hypothetical protein [Hymenobacter volaticus]UOQ67458.1 hypothetical protein MUN86_06150 [Hymenobacter volaticus]